MGMLDHPRHTAALSSAGQSQCRVEGAVSTAYSTQIILRETSEAPGFPHTSDATGAVLRDAEGLAGRSEVDGDDAVHPQVALNCSQHSRSGEVSAGITLQLPLSSGETPPACRGRYAAVSSKALGEVAALQLYGAASAPPANGTGGVDRPKSTTPSSARSRCTMCSRISGRKRCTDVASLAAFS